MSLKEVERVLDELLRLAQNAPPNPTPEFLAKWLTQYNRLKELLSNEKTVEEAAVRLTQNAAEKIKQEIYDSLKLNEGLSKAIRHVDGVSANLASAGKNIKPGWHDMKTPSGYSITLPSMAIEHSVSYLKSCLREMSNPEAEMMRLVRETQELLRKVQQMQSQELMKDTARYSV